MTSLATNADNDLYRGTDGNLVVARGVTAVAQDCEHVMQTQVGEVSLDLSRGVPTKSTIWSNWNPAQFEAAARRMLKTIQNVKSIDAFNITRKRGVATYVAKIKTTLLSEPIEVSGDITGG